ncbi:MAG: hypothetical protein H7257_08510 [Taibaiella sp.]|nr:hypothetical protein [Taibaiella sp.]
MAQLYLLLGGEKKSDMKKIMLISAIAATILSGSCKKAKELANISVDIPYTQQASIPEVDGYTPGVPIPGGVTVPLPAVPIATNSKQYVEQYHTSTNKIVKVSLKTLTIRTVAPAGQTFDFVDNIELFISAPGLPEKLVASQYTVPKGQTTLTLTTAGDVNLKDYFIQDTMYFRESIRINATPPTGTQLEIKSVFNLVANPLY